MIAEQICLLDNEIFQNIQARDFVKTIMNNGKNVESITKQINFFNYISSWVVTNLVNENNLNKRIKLFEKFIQIAIVMYIYIFMRIKI